MTQSGQEEPFFITEEIAAEMIAAGHVFEPPPIACTGPRWPPQTAPLVAGQTAPGRTVEL